MMETPTLTSRQLEVLHLIGRGYSNKAIARQLKLSCGTVASHVFNILNVLGVHDRRVAYLRAVELDLITTSEGQQVRALRGKLARLRIHALTASTPGQSPAQVLAATQALIREALATGGEA